MMEKVDTTPITSHQKLLSYQAAVRPRLNWDFMVNKFPMSWVTSSLEATATRFLKKWVGLARPADPTRLYLPKKKGVLDYQPSVQFIRSSRHPLQPCFSLHLILLSNTQPNWPLKESKI